LAFLRFAVLLRLRNGLEVSASPRHSAMPPVSPSVFGTIVTSDGSGNEMCFALPPPR